MADPDFGLWQAHELFSQLQGLLVGSGLRVQQGHKVVEVLWAELQKGTITAQLLAQAAPAEWIMAIGVTARMKTCLPRCRPSSGR